MAEQARLLADRSVQTKGPDRKQVAADLKAIYRAATAQEAEVNLESFAGKWDIAYPVINKSCI